MSTVLTTHALAAAARRDTRHIAVFVAASLLLHTTLVLTLPGWRRAAERDMPLQVRIERIEPPRPLPMAPPEPPRVEKRPREKPQPVRERVVQPQPQPLALPKEASVEPVFTTPVAEPQPASPPQAAPPTEGPPSAAAKGTGDKITPPVFNAAYLRNPAPAYPISSRRRGDQGTVLLKVLVTRDGAPAAVNVEKTSGFSALDEAAMDAVRKWRFTPAKKGAEPVESAVLVPIVFRLEGVS